MAEVSGHEFTESDGGRRRKGGSASSSVSSVPLFYDVQPEFENHYQPAYFFPHASQATHVSQVPSVSVSTIPSRSRNTPPTPTKPKKKSSKQPILEEEEDVDYLFDSQQPFLTPRSQQQQKQREQREQETEEEEEEQNSHQRPAKHNHSRSRETEHEPPEIERARALSVHSLDYSDQNLNTPAWKMNGGRREGSIQSPRRGLLPTSSREPTRRQSVISTHSEVDDCSSVAESGSTLYAVGYLEDDTATTSSSFFDYLHENDGELHNNNNNYTHNSRGKLQQQQPGSIRRENGGRQEEEESEEQPLSRKHHQPLRQDDFADSTPPRPVFVPSTEESPYTKGASHFVPALEPQPSPLPKQQRRQPQQQQQQEKRGQPQQSIRREEQKEELLSSSWKFESTTGRGDTRSKEREGEIDFGTLPFSQGREMALGILTNESDSAVWFSILLRTKDKAARDSFRLSSSSVLHCWASASTGEGRERGIEEEFRVKLKSKERMGLRVHFQAVDYDVKDGLRTYEAGVEIQSAHERIANSSSISRGLHLTLHARVGYSRLQLPAFLPNQTLSCSAVVGAPPVTLKVPLKNSGCIPLPLRVFVATEPDSFQGGFFEVPIQAQKISLLPGETTTVLVHFHALTLLSPNFSPSLPSVCSALILQTLPPAVPSAYRIFLAGNCVSSSFLPFSSSLNRLVLLNPSRCIDFGAVPIGHSLSRELRLQLKSSVPSTSSLHPLRVRLRLSPSSSKVTGFRVLDENIRNIDLSSSGSLSLNVRLSFNPSTLISSRAALIVEEEREEGDLATSLGEYERLRVLGKVPLLGVGGLCRVEEEGEVETRGKSRFFTLRNVGDRHAFVVVQPLNQGEEVEEDDSDKTSPQTSLVFVEDTARFQVSSSVSGVSIIYGDEVLRMKRRRNKLRGAQLSRHGKHRLQQGSERGGSSTPKLDRWDSLQITANSASAEFRKKYQRLLLEEETEAEADLDFLDGELFLDEGVTTEREYEKTLCKFEVFFNEKRTVPVTYSSPSRATKETSTPHRSSVYTQRRVIPTPPTPSAPPTPVLKKATRQQQDPSPSPPSSPSSASSTRAERNSTGSRPSSPSSLQNLLPQGLIADREMISFSVKNNLPAGGTVAIEKLLVGNSTNKDLLVRISSLQPPFEVKHSSVTLKPRSYVNLPVRFISPPVSSSSSTSPPTLYRQTLLLVPSDGTYPPVQVSLIAEVTN